jgi:hypothetical protein
MLTLASKSEVDLTLDPLTNQLLLRDNYFHARIVHQMLYVGILIWLDTRSLFMTLSLFI